MEEEEEEEEQWKKEEGRRQGGGVTLVMGCRSLCPSVCHLAMLT